MFDVDEMLLHIVIPRQFVFKLHRQKCMMGMVSILAEQRGRFCEAEYRVFF